MATTVRTIRIPILSDIRASLIKWVYSDESNELVTASKIAIGLVLGAIISTIFWGIILGLLAKFIGYTEILGMIVFWFIAYFTFWLVNKDPTKITDNLTLSFILGVLLASLISMLLWYFMGGAILSGLQSILEIFGTTQVTQSALLLLKSWMTAQSVMFVTSQGVIVLPLLDKLGSAIAILSSYFVGIITDKVFGIIGLRFE